MGSKPAAATRSPELKPENHGIPPVQQKEVLLFEWWLMKAEKDYNGRRLTVGGFTKRGEAVGIFKSSPVVKRHDHCTVETADGINIKIQGSINKTRTIDNGFSLEACNAFFFGFPTAWDKFTEDSSWNKSSKMINLEHQPENIFDPSFQQKTVLLRNWWLRRAEKGSNGIKLAVGGFTECGKAMRLFDSSPIIKRHDAYTLETSDGITIRIEGFINKKRTLDNGFPLEACKTFLIGFPTTWTDFTSGSSWEKSPHAYIPVSASMGAEWSEDPLGLPVRSENTILNNDPSTSNTSLRDSDSKLLNAIRRFTAWVSIYNDKLLQDDESCGANMRDVHTEGAGCLKGNLHVGALAQEESLNHEKRDVIKDAASNTCKKYNGNAASNTGKKYNGNAATEVHHDEGLETSRTNNLSGSVVGNDYQKDETAQKSYEKFDKWSTRRPVKVRPGLSKVEKQNNAKFRVKPVRRSLRLKSLNSKDACGEFQDKAMFFRENNDINCSDLVPEGSKTCTIIPTDTLTKGCSSSPIIRVEAQKLVKSLAKSVRKIETNNTNNANLSTDGPKVDLHIGALAQGESINHERGDFIKDPTSNVVCKKYNRNAATEGHHDEGVETCSTNNWLGSVVGNDHQKEETTQKNYEKFYECSGRRSVKVRSGLSEVENFEVEEQNNAKFRAKPVRRSLRLKSLKSENACEEFQHNSMFFSETNDINCANVVPEGSKTCTIIHPTDTLAEGCSSSPIICVEAQKLVKSLAKPVRKSETNNTNNDNLSTDGPKTYAESAESPLSPTSSSILLPSVRLISEQNQDGHQDSIKMGLEITPTSNSTSKFGFCDDSASTACLGQNLNDKKNVYSDILAGLVEATPANSEVVTSQTTGKRILRCSMTKKVYKNTRSGMKVERNESRNQSSYTRFKEKEKNVEVSAETERASDKTSHKMRFRTVWVSSYKDFHGAPITRSKKNKQTIITPESSNLKRSRSGRVLVPRLDSSMRVVYEPDGSFLGTAAVDGSGGGTASLLMLTSPSKGSGKLLHRKKRERQ